jgi:hypothetical protein
MGGRLSSQDAGSAQKATRSGDHPCTAKSISFFRAVALYNWEADGMLGGIDMQGEKERSLFRGCGPVRC